MELKKGSLKPGIVLEVYGDGKIKATVPGLFDIDSDLNPPIMPFNELIGPHRGSFSLPNVGDIVWVLSMTDNPMQLYWFRKCDNESLDEIISNADGGFNETVEVLSNFESGTGYASIYFTDGSGWVIKNDDSKIQIKPDGSIEMGLDWPHRQIIINEDSIQLGGNSHYACYGDEVSTILEKLCGIFEIASKASKSNPYTMHLAPIFDMADEIKEYIAGIQSPHVKLE